MIHFRDSSYLSFLADSGAFVLKVSLFVFLNGELAQFGQSVLLLNGRSQVQILYSLISSIEEILYRKKEIIIAGEWNGIPYDPHKFVIAGSTPALQLLLSHCGEI